MSAWWVLEANGIRISGASVAVIGTHEFRFTRYRQVFALARAIGAPKPKLFIGAFQRIWGPF